MQRKLSRRKILGAAGALTGGSALATVATAAPVIAAVTVSDGDALALSLFRQWIAASDEYDRQEAAHPDSDDLPAGDLRLELEDRILEISGGAVALALKTYLALRWDHAAWAGESRLLRIPEYFDDDPDWETSRAVSLLRDAAAVVPEIHELAAAVLHEDAPLIDAQIAVQWAREVLAEPISLKYVKAVGAEHVAKTRRKVETKLAAALDRVANTKAKTARGRAIKAALGFMA